MNRAGVALGGIAIRGHRITSGVERTVTSPGRIQACTEAAIRAAASIGKEEGKRMSLAFPLLGAGAGGPHVSVVCRSMIAGLRDFFANSPDAAIDLVVIAVPEADRFELCARLVAAAFG